MVKNVNSVVHCSISQKAHIQTSEVHQGASISAWGIPRADLGGAGGGERYRDGTDKKLPTLLSQQRRKLQKSGILKELKADTAAIWFPWHVFLGNGRVQRR